MNVNDESTASVHLSGGSVVDGPFASTMITSPSSSGGARTSANADDSASQPNDGTQTLGPNAAAGNRTEYYHPEQSSISSGTACLLSIWLPHRAWPSREIVSSKSSVQCVIEHVPRAASVVTTGGLTSLHVVCMIKNVTQDIVRCVFQGNPDALLAQDEFGKTPLFALCCNRRVDGTVAEEICSLLLETCPESAQCSTHDGHLPIHFACRLRSPDFCCMLIQAYPESIQHEVNGDPFLHHVLFRSSVDDSVAFAVLKMLLENHPRMVRDFRWNGRPLLHYAALNDLSRAAE
eukprot:scaffold21216_cov88-Skeletonema_marinoi.AAC.1